MVLVYFSDITVKQSQKVSLKNNFSRLFFILIVIMAAIFKSNLTKLRSKHQNGLKLQKLAINLLLTNFEVIKVKTKIKWIKLESIHQPLKRPFVTALHRVTEAAAIRARIGLENGLVGYGAATPNEKVTGDSLKSLAVIMDEVIKPQLLGQDISDWEKLLNLLQHSIQYNTPAKAAFEIALYDLRAQLFQTSLTELLGAAPRAIATDYTISIAPAPQILQEARQLVSQGFTSLKIKLGDQSLADDIQLVKQIAGVCPDNVSLRIDVNQAWNIRQTLAAINSWEKANLKIDFVEQPVKANDLWGMQQLVAKSAIPIMADESVHSFADARRLIELHACDLINIKLMKTGGLSQAVKINQLAESAGIQCMIGCMIEAPESIAAAIAFAAAQENVVFVDLDAVFMTQAAGISRGFSRHKNQLLPSSSVGLGFNTNQVRGEEAWN